MDTVHDNVARTMATYKSLSPKKNNLPVIHYDNRTMQADLNANRQWQQKA